MRETRRIVISLPNAMLQEVDALAAMDDTDRSGVFREAVGRYLQQRRRLELRRLLRQGYQEMGSLNLALAEEDLALDQESLQLLAGERLEP